LALITSVTGGPLYTLSNLIRNVITDVGNNCCCAAACSTLWWLYMYTCFWHPSYCDCMSPHGARKWNYYGRRSRLYFINVFAVTVTPFWTSLQKKASIQLRLW